MPSLPLNGRRRLQDAALATALICAPALAQDTAETKEQEAGEVAASFYEETTVTVTGNEIDTFQVAQPVTVIDAGLIEERQPDSASDLLRDQPGVDVNGVGPNQARPIIRGQRGLRVLFLEDGLRMNNPRRQTDFGEISGLVDIGNVENAEVVRGPASVLYGSDAIGGVLNLITKTPTIDRLAVDVDSRYSSADEQTKFSLGLQDAGERIAYSLRYTTREADDYEAAEGSFGDIDLPDGADVIDSGVEDEWISGRLSFQANDSNQFWGRINRYSADDAGFGLVDPMLLDANDATQVRILYPFQDFDRTVLGWQGVDYDNGIFDTAEVKLYRQNNERALVNDIDIDIGPIFGPGPSSSVLADTQNFTDLETTGLRAELTRTIGDNHLLTYGLEAVEDESTNTDFSTTTTVLRAAFPISFICGPAGAVPPPPFECASTTTDGVANAPNAENTAYGIFAQDEARLTDKLSATLGLRYSNVETRALATPGWDITGLDFDDDALVGSLGLIYEINPAVRLVGSYGTAFRAPNIVERLFNGVTPEGLGFQVLNPDLKSEESTNIDFGVKVRTAKAYFEAFYFDTEIDDAIIQFTLDESDIAMLDPATQQEIANGGVDFVVQQRNADVLKLDGFELAGGYRFDNGIEIGANFTSIDGESQNFSDAQDPTGETYSEKAAGFVRYTPVKNRYWLEYRVRHNGEQDPDLDPNAVIGPIGRVIPSFTVHAISAGYRLFDGPRQRHTLALSVDNLTDELYSEFSNAAFFRPQPGRNVLFSYRVRVR